MIPYTYLKSFSTNGKVFSMPWGSGRMNLIGLRCLAGPKTHSSDLSWNDGRLSAVTNMLGRKILFILALVVCIMPGGLWGWERPETKTRALLVVTKEVLIDYVEDRLRLLEGREMLAEEQAEELNFIRENRGDLLKLAEFYGMRIREKRPAQVFGQEKLPVSEVTEYKAPSDLEGERISIANLPADPGSSTEVESQTVQTGEPPSRIIKEREVKQFFAHYAEQYNRRDINGFLSLFSSEALQNGREGFDEIRKIYSDFFDESDELRYHLENMRIEIYEGALISDVFYENLAAVDADYQVDQVLKEGRKKKVWTGYISWILIRENGSLKVRFLDYQPERSSYFTEEDDLDKP